MAASAAQRRSMKRYYDRNREAVRAQQNARRAANPEENAARCRAYYAANKDRVKTAADRWRRANPIKAAATRAAYKARKRGAPFTEAAREFVEVILRDPCVYCGAAATTVDHIDAIRNGGDGDWLNLAPACHSCNASKRATPLLLFLHRRAA